MAVASGYAPPREDALRVGRKADILGEELVEVFRVRRLDGQKKPPCGVIMIVDGNECGILYRRDRPTPDPSPDDNKDTIKLMGPRQAVTAYASTIHVDLHDGTEPIPEDDGYYWPLTMATECDTLLSKVVATPYGRVEMEYIVWRNAIGAEVQAKLLPRDGQDRRICGKIIAHSKFFGIGSLLFDNADGEDVTVSSGGHIPLAKCVVAVPLLWPLIIDVYLRAPDGREIVRCAKDFYPEFYAFYTAIHTKVFAGDDCDVEVEITWSS